MEYLKFLEEFKLSKKQFELNSRDLRELKRFESKCLRKKAVTTQMKFQ